MDPISAISLASSVAGLLTLSGAILSNGYGYVSRVTKAPKELRLLLSETAALYTLLDQLQILVDPDVRDRGTAAGALDTLAKLGTLEEGKALLQTVEHSIQACEQIQGHGTANLGKRLRWPFKEKDTKENLQRFKDLKDILTGAISIDSGLALKRLEQTSISIEGSTSRTEKAITAQAAELEVTRMKGWLGLKSTSSQTNYEDALSLRHSGTGLWFLEKDTYEKWLLTDNGFLWIYGIPGSGKTVLSATIIEHLQTKVQDSKSGLVYFYCDHRDTTKQSFRDFISTGLTQLLAQSPACLDDIKALYTKKKSSTNQTPNQQEYLLLFKAFTLHFERVFVIIDALDEGADIETFIEGLATIIDPFESATRAQILATSRHEVDIQRLIEPNLTASFPLTANIGDDISRYVIAEVHSRVSARKLKLRNLSLEEVIIQALSKGADGMFLWASIQLNHICSLRSDRDIKAALNKLPKGLDETYIRILESIKAKHSDRIEEVKQVLQWLLVGAGTVSLQQIAEAVSIQPGDTCFEIDGVATNPEDVVAVLVSLITISPKHNVNSAQFSHYSVEEFLISERLRDSSVNAFHLDIQMAHAEVAKTCLQYLSFTDFKDPCTVFPDTSDKPNQFFDRAKHYQLYTYAANNWFYHLEKSNLDKDSFDTLILPHLGWFLKISPRNQQYYSWEQFLSNLPRGIVPHTDFPQYYYAILFGLHHILDLVLPKGLNINQAMKFSGGLTPLHFAAMQGHVRIVQKLLDTGAKVNTKTNTRSTTALRLAAENSHPDVVKLLLQAGADPQIKSGSGSTAFYGAARAGDLKSMQILKDAGSDLNVKTWDNWTPILEAVENGNLKAVELLVKWGVELDVQTSRGWTPLKMAESLAMTDIHSVLQVAIEKLQGRR